MTEISEDFAAVLAGLFGEEARMLIGAAGVQPAVDNGRIVTGDNLDVWERKLEEQVESDASVPETDREAIIRARRGQGLFKQRLCELKRAVASQALIIRVTYWPATANRGGIPRMKNV